MNITNLNSASISQFFSSQDVQLDQGRRLSSSVSVQLSQSVTTQTTFAVDKRQEALQLVEQTLARAYEKISSRGLSATEQYQAFEPLTAEKVANNILGFIERRLRLDQADGATQEQLQARLEAGLSGFKKGFAEAEEQLEALSMLSPEVKADIGKTYDLVLEGIDKLRQNLLDGAGEATAAPIAANKPAVTKPAVTDVSQTFVGLGSASSRDFSFELTTREGDKVRISASASQSLGMAYEAAVNGGSRSLSLEGSSSSSQSFSLSIEGELNEDELAAINDLLGKVNNLAGQFYAGNLDAAWDQAMALGFDDQQISDYSLSLRQVEVQLVEVEQVAIVPQVPNPAVASAAQFMRSLVDALDTAANFAEPIRLLEDLARVMDERMGWAEQGWEQIGGKAQEAPGRFGEFVRARLADLQ